MLNLDKRIHVINGMTGMGSKFIRASPSGGLSGPTAAFGTVEETITLTGTNLPDPDDFGITYLGGTIYALSDTELMAYKINPSNGSVFWSKDLSSIAGGVSGYNVASITNDGANLWSWYYDGTDGFGKWDTNFNLLASYDNATDADRMTIRGSSIYGDGAVGLADVARWDLPPTSFDPDQWLDSDIKNADAFGIESGVQYWYRAIRSNANQDSLELGKAYLLKMTTPHLLNSIESVVEVDTPQLPAPNDLAFGGGKLWASGNDGLGNPVIFRITP